MQTTICLLQQQLKETKDLVSNLQAENANMCTLVANQQPAPQQQQAAPQQSQQPMPQQPQHYAPQQSQQPTPQQPQQPMPQQPEQPAPQHPQRYDPAPQQPQHYDRVQATGSSSSVDRTTDAAQTPPHEAVARTTHTPPGVSAVDSYSTAMAGDSRSEHLPMDSDDACFGTQPPPTLHIKVEMQPTSPVAHSYEACTQLVDTRNGRRTTDELDNRTEEEQVGCPTTNGQTPTELSQLDDRSPCRRADETEHISRLHDDEILEDPRLNSRSPDYDTDGTDISSDAWSPRSPPPPPASTHHKLTKQLHHGDTAMSDDDDLAASPDRRSLQTDNSGGTNDVVLNGIAGVRVVKEEPNT